MPANPDRLFGHYPVLKALPAAVAARAAQATTLMRVPAGTVLFDEHQACQGLPLVLAGTVRVVKVSPGGRELPLYRVTPGETCIVSSSCLLGQAQYTARGIATDEVELGLLPRPMFNELMEYPAFRDFVFHLFAERIAGLMHVVEEVAFRRLDQRLAALLLSRAKAGGDGIHATHQALADELGSVREMVSRLLKGFAEQGLVSLGRERIEIQNQASLEKLASGPR